MTLKLSGIGIVGNSILQGEMPSDNEFWSEKASGIWEPREEHKGDIARSVFYFSIPCTQMKEVKSRIFPQ